MGRYLDMIESPADLRKLTLPQLDELCAEMRELLVETVAQTGGHLAPNLGTVELTVALHRVFDAPRDKLVWDVGHQAYPHKILTGRRDRFPTIRQLNGLAGFLRRSESAYDAYGAGHAGTALSAALGMAVARDRRGGDERVVAVVGDAALTCGISFEALNNIADTTRRLIIVLNDNEMSISPNVGAMPRYLNRIITNPVYNRTKRDIEYLIRRIPALGPRVLRAAGRIEEAVKSLLVPGVIFEELGIRYIGPLDGHNLRVVIRALESVRNSDRPVLVHVITRKGKGYAPAEKEPDRWHGTGTFDPATGTPVRKSTQSTWSQVFGDTLCRIAERDSRVVAITAAMPAGTGLTAFADRFPDRFFDVGIAEEHAVLFAAGLAAEGFRPVAAIYSTFLQRAFDPIIHDICLQNLPVIFCLDRAGVVGADGPTHHGVFDIAYLRPIPGMVLMQPRDEVEFADMLETAVRYERGPVAIRYPRGSVPGAATKPHLETIPIGKAEILRGGVSPLILPLGNMSPTGLEVADKLAAAGYDPVVVNPRFVKPLDEETILHFARQADLVVTLEDGIVSGGFGTGVLELVNEAQATVPVMRFGWPDAFVEHGSVSELREIHGLTADAVFGQVLGRLEEGTTRRRRRSSAS